MVEDGALRHKIYSVTILEEILNLGGHPNHINGSRVTAILLNGCILPISEALLRRWRVCYEREQPSLLKKSFFLDFK